MFHLQKDRFKHSLILQCVILEDQESCRGGVGTINTHVWYGAINLSWLAAMVLQSTLENKILRWKVKFEIYFPKWKVV